MTQSILLMDVSAMFFIICALHWQNWVVNASVFDLGLPVNSNILRRANHRMLLISNFLTPLSRGPGHPKQQNPFDIGSYAVIGGSPVA